MAKKKNDGEEKKQKAPNSTKKGNGEGNQPFLYVGIGASAGGLEALEEFFKHVPVDTNMAFMVVQHLSPDYKSMMVELLSRDTKMDVVRVEDGMHVEPNCVYLIPPKQNMTIFHGKLYLKEQDDNRGLNMPIDYFFRSLAMDQEKNAVGVILSGTGSDGTLGIKAIKESGGMVMVQEVSSAKFDGMPKSAISTELVDYVLTPEKMPEELIKYSKHPFVDKSAQVDPSSILGEDVLSKIMEIIRSRIGVDFTFYKPNTIIRRLERRLSINQINKVENYISLLTQSLQEVRILYKELLIGVTQFFRDPEAFSIIEEQVIQRIMKNKDPNDPVRMWTVGCSTGEEAYSLAMLLREYMDKHDVEFDVKIFATDLDKDAIEFASAGFYPESITADVNPERLKNYFTKKNNGYQINEAIRRLVIFAPQNIIKDPPFSKIDLISCRNMLIYLKSDIQKKILSMFHFALNPGGFLFLGSSESASSLTDVFEPLAAKWKIFTYKEGMRKPVLNDLLYNNMRKDRGLMKTQASEMQGDKRMDGLYESILSDFIPPSVLINENLELIQVFGNVNRYIQIPVGKVNWNLMKMVRKEISVLLSSVVHKARKEKKEIKYTNIKLKESAEKGEKEMMVDIVVRSLRDDVTKNEYLLISFVEKTDQDGQNIIAGDENVNLAEQYDERVHELERELQFREENLQTTLEEMETTNEELQSTNEELIASNEELQSTNEELQSVNEELYTVNSEYQNKIEELTSLNNDMNNLLRNTNIGTLFLDSKLRIRKYTEGINKVVNIMEVDIGRPISHISFKGDYSNFTQDVETVMDTLRPKETEIKDPEGYWHMMRIIPYRTEENAVNGVIVTLIDISERKKNEENLLRERDLMYRILESSPMGKVVVDENGEFSYLNKKGEELLEITGDEIKKHFYNNLPFEIVGTDEKPLAENQLPYQIIIQTKRKLNDYVHGLKYKDGKLKWIRVNAAPMFDENGKVNGGVFNMEEVPKPKKKTSKTKK